MRCNVFVSFVSRNARHNGYVDTLLEIAVFKGLGADTINTFNKYRLGNNKYMKVFREEFKVA